MGHPFFFDDLCQALHAACLGEQMPLTWSPKRVEKLHLGTLPSGKKGDRAGGPQLAWGG